VNKVFKPLIGKKVKVYMDDMIIKSIQDNRHEGDMWETFKVL